MCSAISAWVSKVSAVLNLFATIRLCFLRLVLLPPHKSIISVSVSKLPKFLKSKTFVPNGDVTFRLENIPVMSYPRFFALISAARPRFPYPTIPIFIKHRLSPIICSLLRRFTSRGAPIFHNMLLTGVLKKFPLGKIIVYIIVSIRRCRYDKTR